MILKSSVLVVVMVSGLFASENPFAVEENMQKIEKEENAFLELLAKERSTIESDDIPEQSEAAQTVQKEEGAATPVARQNEPKVNVSAPIEKPTKTIEGTPVASEKVDAEVKVAQPQTVEAVKSTKENISSSKEFPVLVEENQSEPQSIESTKSDAKVLELYTKACDGGEIRGCLNLGFMYDKGKGVKEDNSKALELYTKACDGGEMRGCLNLGFMYDKGKGVKEDDSKALELYTKACDGDIMGGCLALGGMEKAEKR